MLTPEKWHAKFGARHDEFATGAEWENTLERWAATATMTADSEWTFGIGSQAMSIRSQNIEASGIVPIFVVPPQGRPLAAVVNEARSAGIKYLINLNDPSEYPDLFGHSTRFDAGHLSSAGADLTSRVLAEEISEIIEALDH